MSDYTLLEDEQLVSLSRDGDPTAFSVLTERYISLSRHHATAFQGSEIEAEDLCQEGMLGFLSAVYSYKDNMNTSFKTYAGKCIKNRIISAVRKSLSKKHIPQSLTVPIHGEADSAIGTVTGPEESLISKQGEEDILSLIEKELTKAQQRVLWMFLSGLSYEEIAQKEGCTKKSVDSTLQRIRKKLREKLS